MNDRAAFLTQIKANPDADHLRLIFADWLDEQDNERDARHAEMIRFQIHLATVKHQHNACGRSQKRPGTGPQCPRCALDRIDAKTWQPWANEQLVPAPLNTNCVFRRGLVDAAICCWWEWRTCWNAAAREHPIKRLLLTVIPPAKLDDIAFSVRSILYVGLIAVGQPQHDAARESFREHKCPNVPQFFLRTRPNESSLRDWFGRDRIADEILKRNIPAYAHH